MIIIQDTREKMPWEFTFYDDCAGQIVQTVKTGDYTIQGYEDQICIERKRTTGEISINFGSKYKQFKRELDRMRSFKYKYIICEFPQYYIDIFPENSTIPSNVLKYIKISANYIRSQINYITETYGVEFIFCKNEFEAQEKAYEIFIEKYNVIKEEI